MFAGYSGSTTVLNRDIILKQSDSPGQTKPAQSRTEPYKALQSRAESYKAPENRAEPCIAGCRRGTTAHLTADWRTDWPPVEGDSNDWRRAVPPPEGPPSPPTSGSAADGGQEDSLPASAYGPSSATAEREGAAANESRAPD